MRTVVAATDRLPLTCTRAGSCCHGREVRLTPVDLARLADALGEDRRAFRDGRCAEGGTRLRMDGAHRWRDRAACTPFDPAGGCRCHAVRPLACRLFPLGRERASDGVVIFHDGPALFCHEACPAVEALPTSTVADYLGTQDLAWSDAIEAGGRDLAAELADDALGLWHQAGLARREPRLPQRWRDLGGRVDDRVALLRVHDLLDPLTLVTGPVDDAATALAAQRQTLSRAIATAFPPGCDLPTLAGALMALALHLAAGLGADTAALAATWAERTGT